MITGSRIARCRTRGANSATPIIGGSCGLGETSTGRHGQAGCNSGSCGRTQPCNWLGHSTANAAGADRPACPRGCGGAGLSRGPAAVASAARAQPRVKAAELPGVGAALPARARRPVHPQPGGAGRADEEGGQKISNGLRSEQGAQAPATLRNVLSSGRKQVRYRLEVLLHGRRAGRFSPRLTARRLTSPRLAAG